MFRRVKRLIGSLFGKLLTIGLPSQLANVDYNKAFWNRYARHWHLSQEVLPIEDPDIPAQERRSHLKYLGDEWGTSSDVNAIIHQYIDPFITSNSIVGEIGSGGARMASKVAPRTKHFYCFDISPVMLRKAQAALAGQTNVSYILLDAPTFPMELHSSFDFVYSFDVFVHLDLHTMWKYFQEIHSILKDGGKVFLHTSNLKAPGGWERFASQDTYSVLGHYFVSPEIVSILAEQSDLHIIKTSMDPDNYDRTNFYINRDYLIVLEKPTRQSKDSDALSVQR